VSTSSGEIRIMNVYQNTALLALAWWLTGWQQTPPAQPPSVQTPSVQTPARPERKPPLIYRIQCGDIDGDGKADLISWDSESKEIVISSYTAGAWKRLTSHKLENFPTNMIASDLDGDGKAELIIGEGLRGYNPKTDRRLMFSFAFTVLCQKRDGYRPRYSVR